MGLLDKLKDTVSIADASQKIYGTATVFKLKNQIKNNEKEIDSLTLQAGRQLVSHHLNDENSEYKEYFQAIKKLQTENSRLMDELQQIKEEQERLKQMKEEQERLKRMEEEQKQYKRMQEERGITQEQEMGEHETFKICGKCGGKNRNGAKFCVQCGNPLKNIPSNGEAQVQTEES